jgi:hypothetical protein
MTGAAWLAIALAWILAWIGGGVAITSKRDDNRTVAAYATLLPAFCALTCLCCFVANPTPSSTFHSIILWVHHFAVLSLFVFLTIAEFLVVEAWWKSRTARSNRSVALSYRRLRALTDLVPGPVAITILLTGLRLIWDDAPANGPSALWIMILIAGFSFFFWDGLLGFTPIVRGWDRRLESEAAGAAADAPARPVALITPDRLSIFAHFVSWPFLFLVGVRRLDFAHPLAPAIDWLRQSLKFLPFGWPEVTVSLIVWLTAGLVVALLRRSLRPMIRVS